MNDDFMSAAADRFADQAMIVAFAVAGRCVEQIDPEIERPANSGDGLRVVCRPIGARHAVTAEPDDRHREISVAKSAAFHKQTLVLTSTISHLPLIKGGSGA